MPRDEIVEQVVVNPGEAISQVRIGPDPVLESRLHLGELALGGLGVGGVQNAFSTHPRRTYQRSTAERR
jgi:hypothetical protein